MALPITFGTTGRVAGLLDPVILDRFLPLDQGDKIAAEYVWIGGTGSDLRSKTKTLKKKPSSVKDLPVWNYDGSSCGQAPGETENIGTCLTAPTAPRAFTISLHHLSLFLP